MKINKYTAAIAALCTLFSVNGMAQESAEELAKAAQNPIANMISFPFQNNTNFGMGPNNRTQNILNVQPVLPFFNGRLITRTILPVTYQPDLPSESGGKNGIGDISFTGFYAPETKGDLIWGVGPAVNIPVGTEGIGVREWGAGPSVVVLVVKPKWVYGGIVNNVWSFDENTTLNFFLFQYFLNYNLPKGLYVTSAPIITSNWNAESGNQWTIPLGAGLGKIVKLGGKLPLNLQTGAYYNVVKPDLGPDWQLRAMAVILLPKSVLKKK